MASSATDGGSSRGTGHTAGAASSRDVNLLHSATFITVYVLVLAILAVLALAQLAADFHVGRYGAGKRARPPPLKVCIGFVFQHVTGSNIAHGSCR